MKAKKRLVKKLKKTHKRPRFKSMLVRRILGTFIVQYAILIAAMMIASEYITAAVLDANNSLENNTNQYLIKTYYDKKLDAKDEENVTLEYEDLARLNLYGGSNFASSYSVFYDENNNEIFESRDTLAAIVREVNSENGDLYFCDKKYVEELFDDYIKNDRSDLYGDSGLEIKVKDFYLLGKEFIPCNVELAKVKYSDMYSPDMEQQIRSYIPIKQYDFSKEVSEKCKKEGYRYVNVEDGDIEKITIILSRTNLSEEEKNEIKAEFMERDGSTGRNSVSYVWGVISDVVIMYKNEIRVDDKTYMFCRYERYDLYKGFRIYVYVIVWFLLGLIVAIVWTVLRFLKLKSRFDLEDYRRSITNSMAHDLKSPLMVISGYAENLKANENPEKQNYYIDAISKNVVYMNEIIGNLLELSKIEQGSVNISFSKVDMRETFEMVIEKYQTLLKEKTLKINIEGDAEIIADDKLMKQVCDNLISNAVKYSKNDTDIRVNLSDKCISVENVCKDAIGCNEADLVKPFVRGSNSRTDKKGTGVGLTIVKNILDMQGFKLTIRLNNDIFTAQITG